VFDLESLLEKAQKCFEKAGANPYTPEQKAAYAQGRKLLSKLAQEDAKKAGSIKLLPSPYKADKRPLWGLGAKIQTIPWREFFTVEKNPMVVYRIIPHANVTNNNKRLWKAIYQMYALYERPGSRLERDGLKFRFREKDQFWFDVVFRLEKGERKIEFYVSTSEYQAKKLKGKLENKMDVTITEANIDALKVPEENTIIQELCYLKHDIFSLNTNTHDESQTPITAILNTIDELQHEGDFARLSFCAEAANRQKWIKNASWAVEKMHKGKIPQRAKMDGKKAANAGKTVISGIINEINDLLVDTFQALSNSIFAKGKSEFTKDKIIKKAFSLEDEIGGKRVGASLEKPNLPVMKTYIRTAAHSVDKLTRETISESLGLSCAELAENNELQAYKVRIGSRRYEIIQELNTLRLSVRSKADGNVNLMSTDEMAKLALQMPGAKLQRRYDDALSVKRRVEVDIPTVLRNDKGMFLGIAELKDSKIPVYFPLDNPDEVYRGYVFMGGQGNGKDTAIKNWVVEGCLKHGIGAIIPEVIVEEGERGMADGIRDSLPPDKVIDIDLGNEDFIVPMDLTEVISKLGRKGASRFAAEIVDFMGDVEGLKRSKRILMTAAKASGGSLYNIKRLLEDEDYRVARCAELLDAGEIRLADELARLGTNEQLGSKADPILDRLGDFFDDDTLFDVFAQPPKPDVDFAKWMSEGKVVIIRIPNRKLSELVTKTLVHWVTLKAFMTRLLMSKTEKANGTFIIFNEPHQYTSDGLRKLMRRIATEGRKECFGSMFAFHHWGLLPDKLADDLQAGGINQFLFASDHTKNFEAVKHRLEPTFTVEDAELIEPHYAINLLRAGGKVQNAFLLHMAPPVSKRFKQYNNEFLTLRHARMYGRKYEDLQRGVV
jgi:hypothetical protein